VQITGEWRRSEDGVTRPIVEAHVVGADGDLIGERFLIDTGSDRTALSAVLLKELKLPTAPPTTGLSLIGVGGASPFVLVTTVLEITSEDGRTVRVRGEFAAFTDPLAVETSVLGRDVLDNFDLIVSRRRNEVLLLAYAHRYRVERT
jgi:hypothetical protein